MSTTALAIRPGESRASPRGATAELPTSRSVTLQFDDNQLLPILYGEHDRNLARIEMRDALEVLGGVSDLDTDAQDLILSADRSLRRASRSLYRRERADQARRALISLSDANQALGTGLGFVIGEGTLMF